MKVGPYRATSSIVMCSWYRARNFSEKVTLVPNVFPVEFLSINPCIRRSAGGAALSCHLFDSHVLLIQSLKSQKDSSSSSRDIRTWIFFVRPLYQETHWCWGYRATSSIVICSWYKVRNFSEKVTLVPNIFPVKFLPINLCIRRPAGGGASSCHLFDCHMLLIQSLKSQRGRSSSSQDIRTWIFFEKPLYLETRWRWGLIVPPLRLSCAPDTKLGISARK